MLKIIVTTSDKYHHVLPIFFYLYQKYWNEPFELVGYDKPKCELPANCTWVSLGVQGTKYDFSNDLRKYFKKQPEYFVWMMEDTFLREPVGHIPNVIGPEIGRIDLTKDIQSRPHHKGEYITAHSESRYRLSTQPSIWNRDFLIHYLKPDLSPWDFETQDPKNDGWDIIGFIDPPVKHNEGIRRFDLYKYNFKDMRHEDIDHINAMVC